MRRRAIPITYSRAAEPNLTQCNLIRQLRDTSRDTENRTHPSGNFADRDWVQIAPNPTTQVPWTENPYLKRAGGRTSTGGGGVRPSGVRSKAKRPVSTIYAGLSD